MSPVFPFAQLSWRVRLAVLAVIGMAAAALHGLALDAVPPHLHHDEIYFGLLSHSLAETGRDLNGRWFPALFQMGTSIHWYPPVSIYTTAVLLKGLALSDVAVRLPNAILGVVNVLLIASVARRLLRHDGLSLLAAALLLTTPAHLIHSRISTDSLYPVTIILLWLWLLLRYTERPRLSMALAAGSVLGVGLYTYIASLVMMPIYLLLTGALLYGMRAPWRVGAATLAGFVWPMVFGAVFLATHPEVIGHFSTKYDLGSSGASLNAFQQLRESMTTWAISDRLNSLHSAFAPGYLFVTGGSNIAHSTRLAGVFLVPLAVLLAAGIYDVLTRPNGLKLVVLAGFATAPVAAVVVPEDFAIPRMLGLLPFGVLLAVMGASRLWAARLDPRWTVPVVLAAGVATATGLGYAVLARPSGSAMALVVAGLALGLTATLMARTARWAPAVALLLAGVPLQFGVFAADYFGDYRARATGRYGYNLRGAIEQLIALRDRSGNVPVYLNTDIPYVHAYWEFYLRVHNRRDLLAAADAFDTRTDLLDRFAPGSLFLSDATDVTRAVLGQRADYREVGSSTDAVAQGFGEGPVRTSFLIYQKQ